MLAEGMRTFRFDTFGSEEFWGGAVKLHQAIQGEKLGGVGPGLSPWAPAAIGPKLTRVQAALGDTLGSGRPILCFD
jgi:hypothetical protein